MEKDKTLCIYLSSGKYLSFKVTENHIQDFITQYENNSRILFSWALIIKNHISAITIENNNNNKVVDIRNYFK